MIEWPALWADRLLKIIVPYGLSSVMARRLFKGVLSTMICFSLVCIDATNQVLGPASYIIVIIAVISHPARRFGAMLEVVLLVLIGGAIGLAYLALGHFLALKIYDYSGLQNALAFLAVFEIIMLFAHGFIRSIAPRLFQLAFILFLVVHFGFLSSLNVSVPAIVKEYAYPILFGVAICLVVNLLVMPEFGSTHLGSTVVEGMNKVHLHINTTVLFFLGHHDNDEQGIVESLRMEGLLAQKSSVRTALATCKGVLVESIFEISYSFMSPQELKPLVKKLNDTTISTNSLVGACELEYALLGETHLARSTSDSSSSAKRKYTEDTNTEDDYENSDIDIHEPKSLVDSVRPKREIEFGDKELLLQFLVTVRNPVLQLQESISESLNAVNLVIAQAYDVPESNVQLLQVLKNSKEQSDGETPRSLDDMFASLKEQISQYDATVANSLARINLGSEKGRLLFGNALMPRDEFFLLSSFLLNLREFARYTLEFINFAKEIKETRKKREESGFFGRRVWFSGFSSRKVFKKYLSTGGTEVKESGIASTRDHEQEERSSMDKKRDLKGEKATDPDELNQMAHPSTVSDNGANWRSIVADIIEFPSRYKSHVRYAFKFTLLLMLVSFPAFSPSMQQWYLDIRGTWVGFNAAVSFESSIGGTIKFFIARTIGLVLGSAWGYASYEAGHGTNRYVIAVMIGIGIVAGFYVLLASPYPKAGFVNVVSANIVVLSTIRPSVPGTILENFAKRCLSMLVGGVAAFLVQVSLYPVKARVELKMQVIKAVQNCQRLVWASSKGIDGRSNLDREAHSISHQQMKIHWRRAKKALVAAEANRIETKQEPRIKGSFEKSDKIYKEIIFVLHQITDKFQNIAFLRNEYGSAIMEDLNQYVYTYRRDMIGSAVSILRAVEGALANNSPLPQYLPSARIAQLRIVNRVREVLASDMSRPASQYGSIAGSRAHSRSSSRAGSMSADVGPLQLTGTNVLDKRFMSWAANTAAFEEVIEYIEELVELTKLLVGVHEFRSGFLSRPLYDDWAAEAIHGHERLLRRLTSVSSSSKGTKDKRYGSARMPKKMRKRAFSVVSDVPESEISRSRAGSTSEQWASKVSLPLKEEDEDEKEEVPLTLKRIATRKNTDL